MNQLAIVNRCSGGIQSRRQLHALLDEVARVASETVFTEYAGHARELAAKAEAFDRLIVVGGDGTLLEALNGADLRRQNVAVIPTGRGNSLARDLGLYPIRASLDALRSNHTSRIDLMEVSFEDGSGQPHQRLCGSTVALGYPAAVVRLAGTRFRRLGVYCYAAAGACTKPAAVRMKLLERNEPPVEKDLTGWVANNTRHLANFVALPKACCHDGHFDVMEMSGGRFGQTLHNISALSKLGFYPVTVRPMIAITLQMNEPHDLILDGELIAGVVSVHVAIRPAAADFVCQQRHI